MSGPLVGVGFAVLAAVGIAVQSLAVRLGTRTHSVWDVTAVIFAVNLVVLVPVAAVVAAPDYHVTVRSVLAFATAGVLGSLVARLSYFVGIARIGAARTEPLKALFPVVAIVIAVVVLDERVTLPLLGGVALVLGGSIAVLFEVKPAPSKVPGRGGRVDVVFPLTAAFFLGVDPIFTKIGLADGTPAFVGLAIRIVAGAAGFAIYLRLRVARDGTAPSFGVTRWILVASLANTVYLLSYYAALARTTVSVVTPVLAASTLLVVAGAATFVQADERVTWRLGVAALVVASGVVLVALA